MQWLRADAAHRRAWVAIEKLSVTAQSIPKDKIPEAWLAWRDPAAVSAVHRRKTRVQVFVRLAIAASIAACAIGIALTVSESINSHRLVAEQLQAVEIEREHLETALGENRMFALKDGSHVTLGAQTAIEVELSKQIRRIRLARGEAYFEVAKNSERPFVVEMTMATVTATGTAFNIHRDGHESIVTVTEGQVRVDHLSSVPGYSHKQELILNAGEQAQVTVDELTRSHTGAAVEDVLSWQHGRLAFEGQRLSDILKDVNRYTSTPIRVASDEVGNALLTTTVTTDNIDGWIESIEQVLYIKAQRDANEIVFRPETQAEKRERRCKGK